MLQIIYNGDEKHLKRVDKIDHELETAEKEVQELTAKIKKEEETKLAQ